MARAVLSAGCKQPINLSLSEDLVAECRQYGGNLSATVESLLRDYVQQHRLARQQQARLADRCADDWNALHDTVGSFADEHSTL